MQDGLWTGHEVTWWDIRTVLVIFWAQWILRNTSTVMMCHMTNLIALLTGMKSIVTFKDNDPHSPDIHGVGRAILHSNAFLAWFRNYKLRLCDSSRLLRLYFEFMALHLLITAADTTYKRCSFNWNCVNGLTELWRCMKIKQLSFNKTVLLHTISNRTSSVHCLGLISSL